MNIFRYTECVFFLVAPFIVDLTRSATIKPRIKMIPMTLSKFTNGSGHYAQPKLPDLA